MKNMKKWIGIITAGVMCLALGMTAVAAPSPASKGIVQEVTTATDADGNAVSITIEALDETGETAAAELKDTEALQAIIGDAYVDGMELLDAQNVTAEGVTAWPVTISFVVPGVLPTTKVAVLHYNGSEWEVVPSKAGEGTIEATFESLSPVAFIVDKNTMAAGTTGSATSPKTGESTVVMVFAMVALLAAGGAWALSTKKRA